MNTDIPKIRLSSPQDAIAVVPHLFGFHPSPGSLVVMAFTASRNTVVLRYDIPLPRHAANLTAHLITCLAAQRADEVIIIGYGPAGQVTPILTAARDGLDGLLTIREILRVTDSRWWSLMCGNPSCCPPEGNPCDSASTIPAALATFQGSAPLPSRASLAATIAPVTGTAAAKMREATQRAEGTAARLVRRDGPRTLRQRGLASVQAAIRTYRDGGSISPVARHVWLALVLLRLPVRDDAWARMDPSHRDSHRRLWTDVVRHAQPGYIAAPASLLAFTAWQAGDGALANIALDRALTDDPSYSLALLLRDALSRGAPPSIARPTMTPDEVAASYTTSGPGGRIAETG